VCSWQSLACLHARTSHVRIKCGHRPHKCPRGQGGRWRRWHWASTPHGDFAHAAAAVAVSSVQRVQGQDSLNAWLGQASKVHGSAMANAVVHIRAHAPRLCARARRAAWRRPLRRSTGTTRCCSRRIGARARGAAGRLARGQARSGCGAVRVRNVARAATAGHVLWKT
jgi:hypothetical protein